MLGNLAVKPLKAGEAALFIFFFSYSLDLGGDLKFQDRVTGCQGPVMLSRVSEYDVYTRYYNRYDIL